MTLIVMEHPDLKGRIIVDADAVPVHEARGFTPVGVAADPGDTRTAVEAHAQQLATAVRTATLSAPAEASKTPSTRSAARGKKGTGNANI